MTECQPTAAQISYAYDYVNKKDTCIYTSAHLNLCICELPCLSPQHHSDQGMKDFSVLPSLSLSLPGKTAT